MTMNEVSYELTNHEMMFLAAAVGGNTFLGFTYDEDVGAKAKAEQMWETVKPSLLLKNYIFETEKGFMTIDKQLTDCMDICVNPEYFIFCKVRDNDEEKACNFYACDNRFIKLEQDTAAGNQYVLTPIKSKARLNMSLRDYMDLNGTYPEPDTVPEPALADIPNTLRNHEKMRTLLLILMNEVRQENLFVYAEKYLWKLSIDNDCEDMKLSVITSEAYNDELTRILDLITFKGH